MIAAIIEIILGVFIWRVVPSWITTGSKSTRDTIALICNILGVLIVIGGIISLVRWLL